MVGGGGGEAVARARRRGGEDAAVGVVVALVGETCGRDAHDGSQPGKRGSGNLASIVF